MVHILVTGSSGFLGSVMLANLLKKKIKFQLLFEVSKR